MINLTAKLANGKSMKIQAKSSWEELTFGELLRIENQPGAFDPIELFSILTGFEFDEVANSSDERIMDAIVDVTRFLYSNPIWKELPCPTKLLINHRLYDVPLNVNDITIGQKVLLGQLAALKDKTITELIPRATAIIMITPMFGKFSKKTQDKIDEVEEQLLQSDALSVYGAGQFFFLNSTILSSIGRNNLTASQSSSQTKQLVH